MTRFVKICGLTCIEDADAALAAGADALGLNLIPESKRSIDWNTAADIAGRVNGRGRTVAVVTEAMIGDAEHLRVEAGVDWIQVHGYGGERKLPREAFAAVSIGGWPDVERARSVPGDLLLVDARVPGQLGGTGVTFDWSLVETLATERRLILAGGLHPGNVEQAVRQVRPYGVDVASGVEVVGNPRRKDAELMRHFVAAARRA